MRKLTIQLGLSLMALAGCTQYAWIHDSKSTSLADKELLRCEERAVSVYPTTVATDVSGGRNEGASTACDSSNKSASCATTTGKSTGISSRTRDINSSNRRAYIKRCMRADGWRQVAKPD